MFNLGLSYHFLQIGLQMKKISTLFLIDYDDNHQSTISNVVRPENRWVYEEPDVRATVKFDGTACAIIDGVLYKRYDVKPTKYALKKHIKDTPWTPADFSNVPEGAIPCQEPDFITGQRNMIYN